MIQMYDWLIWVIPLEFWIVRDFRICNDINCSKFTLVRFCHNHSFTSLVELNASNCGWTSPFKIWSHSNFDLMLSLLSGNTFYLVLTRVKTVLTVLMTWNLSKLIVVWLILYLLVVYSIKVHWTISICYPFLVVWGLRHFNIRPLTRGLLLCPR